MNRRLGKLEAKHDARALWFHEIFDQALAAELPVEDFDWCAHLPEDLGMMRNDEIGLCSVAGVAHMIQVHTAVQGGIEVTLSDDDVVDAYKAITLKVNGRAYDPTDPSTDTGLALLDVLKYWRSEGIGGHKIGAFAKLRHEDIDEIRRAGRACGGLYTGALLPISAENQIGETWRAGSTPEDEPSSWGPHCMALVAAAKRPDGGDAKYVTWGKRQDADLSWVTRYADEMFAVISLDWVTGDRPAPSGISVDKLRAYLATL